MAVMAARGHLQNEKQYNNSMKLILRRIWTQANKLRVEARTVFIQGEAHVISTPVVTIDSRKSCVVFCTLSRLQISGVQVTRQQLVKYFDKIGPKVLGQKTTRTWSKAGQNFPPIPQTEQMVFSRT